MHNELITIGIPVYNMEKSILIAIDSCLKQSYKNLEILIVDDGSSDNSIKMIRQNISDSRVRIYQRQQNGGVCAAMQDLVEQAKGEYICFLDADDTMMSTRVEKQYMAIKSAEKRYPSRMIASFCGSEVNDITAGKKYRIDPNDLWNANAKHSFGGGTGHSMYRVADLMKLGNFDSRFSRSADSAMCILFLMNGGFYANLLNRRVPDDKVYGFLEAKDYDQTIFDEFVRIPDYISGTIASMDFENVGSIPEKHYDLFDKSIVDNERIYIMHIKHGQNEDTLSDLKFTRNNRAEN